jgi:Phospholipase_D-nuclease N-terminal
VIVAIGFFAVFGIGILGLIILALWVVGLVDLAKRPDLDRRARMAWLLLIVLLPVIGTLVYFARRPTLPDERERIIAAAGRRHQGG